MNIHIIADQNEFSKQEIEETINFAKQRLNRLKNKIAYEGGTINIILEKDVCRYEISGLSPLLEIKIAKALKR